VLLGGRPLPPRLLSALRLLAPALLAALVVTQVFASGRDLTIDARAAGLVAAVIALLVRPPTLVIIGSAAITTALVRLLV
jgi:branched-subunit amino acid transport protein